VFNVFLINGRAVIDLRPATLCSFITIQIPQHPVQKSSPIGIRGTFLENFDTRRSSRVQDLNKQGLEAHPSSSKIVTMSGMLLKK